MGTIVGAQLPEVKLFDPLLPVNMSSVVTLVRSQQTVWLKLVAPLNIDSMSVTLLTSHAETSLLKDEAS